MCSHTCSKVDTRGSLWPRIAHLKTDQDFIMSVILAEMHEEWAYIF